MCRTLLLLAKVCTARKVVRSSFPLICRADSSLDHCPLVQKPLQHAPQPPLEASDLITRSGTGWWIGLPLLVPRWVIHQLRSCQLSRSRDTFISYEWWSARLLFLSRWSTRYCSGVGAIPMWVAAKTHNLTYWNLLWSFLHSCLISFIFALGSSKVIVFKSMMDPRYSIL